MDAAWSTRASVSGEGRGGASAVGREGEVLQRWGGRGRGGASAVGREGKDM